MSGKYYEEGSLFKLFEGEIPGSVENRYTGNVHRRRDLMNLYHYLIIRSVKDPANTKLRKLVRMVADLLDIPDDIHQSLIIEAWKDKDRVGPVIVDPFVKADTEAMYSIRTGDVYVDMPTHGPEAESGDDDKETGHGHVGLMDSSPGVYDREESETYSLLDEMEEDEVGKDRGTSIMDTDRDSPFYSEGWGRRNEGRKVGDHTTFKDLKS